MGTDLRVDANYRQNHSNKLHSHKNFTIEGNKNLCNVENTVKLPCPNNRKMYLVLDLDHTLLNSSPIDDLSNDEGYLSTKLSSMSMEDMSKRGLFRVESIGVITKLRPFLRVFLSEVSKMFEVFIYTMGDRAYALEMAKLLDPEKKYFSSRIISRDDCLVKHKKGLDVLKKPENSVLILDDTEKIWPDHKDNLIVMDRYMYFSSSCRQFGYKCKSLSELKRDEDELDGALSTVLHVLKRIHRDYISSPDVQDVREILRNVRRTVLRGCKIVFSGIIDRNSVASEHRLWKMAEELGATCRDDVENDVTHVVSLDGGTKKSKWAMEEGKFLVHPRWIEAAFILWRRQLEEKFELQFKAINNNLNLQSMLEKEKLDGDNFLDWYQNLKVALKVERIDYVLQTPLPNKPEESAPQTAHNAYKRHTDHSRHVACYMLATMVGKLQDQFMEFEAYDMILQLKNLFEDKTCTNGVYGSLLNRPAVSKIVEENKVESKGNVLKVSTRKIFKKSGKGKKFKDNKRNKKRVSALKARKKLVIADQKCFYCNQLAHWKRNCPRYLYDIKNGVLTTESGIGTRRMLETFKAKPNL